MWIDFVLFTSVIFKLTNHLSNTKSYAEITIMFVELETPQKFKTISNKETNEIEEVVSNTFMHSFQNNPLQPPFLLLMIINQKGRIKKN